MAEKRCAYMRLAYASRARSLEPQPPSRAGLPMSRLLPAKHGAPYFAGCGYRITGNSPAIVVAAALQAGCPHPLALTPIGNPAGLVMS